jgi:hypothetical protein
MSAAHPNLEEITSVGPACTQETSVTTLDFASTTTATFDNVAIIQLNDDLWRITRTTGEVLGYIDRFVERGDFRFRAKRLIVRQNRFVSIGEFWRMDDAFDCFRFN